MHKASPPDELLALRKQIDALDEELLALLARRFAVTNEVGRLKAAKRLDSVDPVREQEKLERLQALAAAQGMNGEFVKALFQMIFTEVVKNHRRFLEDRK